MSFESLCLPAVSHAASQAGDCSECCCEVVSGRQADRHTVIPLQSGRRVAYRVLAGIVFVW